MDQEKDWGKSGVFLCLLGLGILLARVRLTVCIWPSRATGDGKGITGGMLLDQGAKVVLLGDLSAVDAYDAVTGLQTGLVGGAALHNIHNVNAVAVTLSCAAVWASVTAR